MDKISIDKNTRKRVNAFAMFVDADSTRYPQYPKDRLEWIDPPIPPADYSDETYYRTEQDDAPYVIYTKKSDEQIAQMQQAKTNAQSLAYLAETDWMVTRFAETGVAIPEDIKAARQAARDAIVKPEPVQP